MNEKPFHLHKPNIQMCISDSGSIVVWKKSTDRLFCFGCKLTQIIINHDRKCSIFGIMNGLGRKLKHRKAIQ